MAKIRRIIDFEEDLIKQLDNRRRELGVERKEDVSRNQAVNEAVRLWLEHTKHTKKEES